MGVLPEAMGSSVLWHTGWLGAAGRRSARRPGPPPARQRGGRPRIRESARTPPAHPAPARRPRSPPSALLQVLGILWLTRRPEVIARGGPANAAVGTLRGQAGPTPTQSVAPNQGLPDYEGRDRLVTAKRRQ